MFKSFPWSGFGDIEVQFFSVFPRWRLYHVTFDVIITTANFCRRRRHIYLGNVVSIGTTVTEKMNFRNADTHIWHTDKIIIFG